MFGIEGATPTAKFIVNKSIKGDILPGSVVDIKYQDVVSSLDDPIGPGFQGHSPKPKVSENWKVFVDRYGSNTFKVVPPNGWWPSENVECWLETSARPILERHEHGNYASASTGTWSNTITIYSDGTVYLTEKSEFFPEENTLIATLSPEALDDIKGTIHLIEPGIINFSNNPVCSNTQFVEYHAKKYDFQFQTILFAQANECSEGYVEYDYPTELSELKKILDSFSYFLQD